MEISRRNVLLLALVIGIIIAALTASVQDTAPEPAIKPEPDAVTNLNLLAVYELELFGSEPGPGQETEPVTVSEPEPGPGPEPNPEPDPVTDLVTEPGTESGLEPEPNPEPEPGPTHGVPEPIQIVVVAPPVIPDAPVIPDIPEEVETPESEEILDRVERYNAQPGVPVPKEGAVAGNVNRVHSSNTMEINGVLLRLSGVSGLDEDDADFDEARQSLMRLCPVGSLALYDSPKRAPDEQGRISTKVWCYGYPSVTPLATVNEVMKEAPYDLIGRDCAAPHEGRLLGCTY